MIHGGHDGWQGNLTCSKNEAKMIGTLDHALIHDDLSIMVENHGDFPESWAMPTFFRYTGKELHESQEEAERQKMAWQEDWFSESKSWKFTM